MVQGKCQKCTTDGKSKETKFQGVSGSSLPTVPMLLGKSNETLQTASLFN